ncbi:SWIM-type domain-containing protein [Pycnococcus provasolii]
MVTARDARANKRTKKAAEADLKAVKIGKKNVSRKKGPEKTARQHSSDERTASRQARQHGSDERTASGQDGDDESEKLASAEHLLALTDATNKTDVTKVLKRKQRDDYTEIHRVPWTGEETWEHATDLVHQASGHKMTGGQRYPVTNTSSSKADTLSDTQLFDEKMLLKCAHNKQGCRYKAEILHDVATKECVISTCGVHDVRAHEQRTRQGPGLTHKQKEFADNALRTNSTPLEILRAMRKAPPRDGLATGGLPKLDTLQNYARKNRLVVNGPVCGDTIGELKKWCEEHSAVPDDEHEVFVLDSWFGPEGKFRIILSTKVQLESVKKQYENSGLGIVFLAVDATYKVNLEKRPVIPFGTVDWDQTYHDVCVCLISEKTENHDHFEFALTGLLKGLKTVYNMTLSGKNVIMMADNAASIRNGVDDTIENLVPDEQPKKVTKLTCYPHLKGPHGALHKNKSKIKKGDECYERMKIDVMKLHQVPAGLAIYVIAVLFSLLVAKWNKNDEEAWASWLSTYWRVGVHWSRAYGVPGIPHHNNHLEHGNRELKKALAGRIFTFTVFLGRLVDYIKSASMDEKDGSFPKHPTISAHDWQEAQRISSEHLTSISRLNQLAGQVPCSFQPTQDSKLIAETDGDENVKVSRRVGKHSNPEFVKEVEMKAAVRARQWEACFLGDDEGEELKKLTFTQALELLNSFYLVEPLCEDEKLSDDVVCFSCTCHGCLSDSNPTGFQCLRKCKHVLAHGIRTGAISVPEDYILGRVSVKQPPHRTKKAGFSLQLQEE